MRIVVVGTGTGVGKTHVARALAWTIRARGRSCAALKPIETGGEEDGRALEAAASFHVKPPAPYRLARPVSPHLAARAQGERISLQRVATWVSQASQGADITLVETAGGLFSPLSEQSSNADLVAALMPARVLLVAPDRLGVLHDIRALVLASKTVPLPEMTAVLSSPPGPDASTGTNAAELERLGICPIAATFPAAAPEEPLSARAAAAVLGCWT